MSHTIRDLEYAWADRVGGERGRRLRAALAKRSSVDLLLDRPMTDAEFAAALAKIENVPKKVARLYAMPGDAWGEAN